MKNIKRMLALVLAMMMVLCLFACGNDDNGTTEPDTSTTTESQPQVTKPQATEPDDEKDPEPVEFVYTVVVKDTAGNPIAGVPVQICAGESCVPKVTDANGIAGYDTEINGNEALTAKLIKVPEGYTAEVTEIVMEGVDSVEFVLKADSADTTDFVYTVQVITTEDVGIAGAWVQICAGSTCVPKQTDARGMAGYEEEITGDGALTVKLINIPEGYELAEGEEAEIALADGSTDAIFVLRAI
jgi:hypothetical protein